MPDSDLKWSTFSKYKLTARHIRKLQHFQFFGCPLPGHKAEGRNPVTCAWLYIANVQIFNIIEIFEEHLLKQCGTRRGPINAPQSITGMI